MPNFEVFTKRMIPLQKKPFVTINKRGTLSLNAAAFAAIGRPDAVELLFDAAERVIGIRATDDEAEHGYPVRAQGGKEAGPFLVSGKAFSVYYGIDTTVSRRYTVELTDGALCFDLNANSVEVTSNRSKAAFGDPVPGERSDEKN